MNAYPELVGSVRTQYANNRIPRVLTFPTSLGMMMESGMSLARIGDGELLQVAGMSSMFERGDSSVGSAIERVMTNPKRRCMIGINRAHYYKTENLHRYVDYYVESYWKDVVNLKDLNRLFCQDFYLDACLTIPRHHYALPNEYWSEYFNAIRHFFTDKRLIVVSGDPEVIGPDSMYRKFSKEFRPVTCGMRGAWSERDRIKADLYAMNASGDYLVVLACGPTATVLAWELCDDMQVLDLGHLSREFDRWQKGVDPTSDSASFFGS